MNMTELVETIFDYKSKNGYNCMMSPFEMIGYYHNETGNVPDSSMEMFNEIESTILYLIKLAEDNKLNLENIINWVTEDGQTLFWRASLNSESLALELLSRNVDVKTVDSLFQTVSFKVINCFVDFI